MYVSYVSREGSGGLPLCGGTSHFSLLDNAIYQTEYSNHYNIKKRRAVAQLEIEGLLFRDSPPNESLCLVLELEFLSAA